MRSRRLLIIVVLFAATAARADVATYLNVGLRVGYTIGDRGGITMGGEVSVSRLEYFGHISSYGVTLAVDRCHGAWGSRTKLHFGVEGMLWPVGLDIGPTIVTSGERTVGVSTAVFTGGVVYPFFSMTFAPTEAPIPEAGILLKLPVFLEGHAWSMH